MIVEFDKTIYSEKAVRRAIADYAGFTEIEMTSTPEACVCSVVRSDYSMEKTALEFSNYVLNLSVMSGKEA